MTSTQDVINHIKTIPSLDQLDSFSVKFFNKHAVNNYPDVVDAIARREIELEMEGQDPYAIDVEIDIPEAVPTDLVRKKPAAPKKEKRIFKYAQNVQCGCESKYGVPCLHRLHLDDVGPDDYTECDTCGCDHKYDSRLAQEVHSKLHG